MIRPPWLFGDHDPRDIRPDTDPFPWDQRDFTPNDARDTASAVDTWLRRVWREGGTTDAGR